MSVIAENRDALCTAIHPAPEPPIPSLHFKNCGGVRALGVTRGSYAMFACRTGSNIYYDAALSQEIDYQAGVDTSGESATVYIVPLEENR